MPDKLLTVASLPTPAEAAIVRSRLELEGIRSYLSGENVVSVNWMLGNAVGGVLVQVADSDYARAIETLAVLGPDWKCPRCGEEMTGEFDVCWACGTSRDEQLEPADAASDAGSAPVAVIEATTAATAPPEEPSSGTRWSPGDADLSNPYRSPRTPVGVVEVEVEPTGPPDTTEGDAIAQRAWRASVFGLVFCPVVLQFYSAYLLLVIALKGLPLSRTGSRHYGAWAFDLVFILAPMGALGFVMNGASFFE